MIFHRFCLSMLWRLILKSWFVLPDSRLDFLSWLSTEASREIYAIPRTTAMRRNDKTSTEPEAGKINHKDSVDFNNWNTFHRKPDVVNRVVKIKNVFSQMAQKQKIKWQEPICCKMKMLLGVSLHSIWDDCYLLRSNKSYKAFRIRW